MELGQYQLQVFVSLVVILLAALVALICDFLKGNNEQLRELLIELKVRREEDRRRIQQAALVEKREEPPARLETAPVADQPEPVVAETAPTPEPAAPAPKTNWSSVLARGAEAAKSGDQLDEDIRAAASLTWEPTPAGTLPAGFHDSYVLRHLVENGAQVSGLVVSIGVNRAPGGLIPDAVRHLMQSLIGSGDFACQSSDDEFLLVYPDHRGASAQRRLSEIAQELWDFQLRSLGTFSILFSWGGIEVRDESIEEAIASANERMQETRRGRKLLMMKPANRTLRHAV